MFQKNSSGSKMRDLAYKSLEADNDVLYPFCKSLATQIKTALGGGMCGNSGKLGENNDLKMACIS